MQSVPNSALTELFQEICGCLRQKIQLSLFSSNLVSHSETGDMDTTLPGEVWGYGQACLLDHVRFTRDAVGLGSAPVAGSCEGTASGTGHAGLRGDKRAAEDSTTCNQLVQPAFSHHLVPHRLWPSPWRPGSDKRHQKWRPDT